MTAHKANLEHKASPESLRTALQSASGLNWVRRIPLRENIVYVAFFVLCAIFWRATPYFLTTQNFGIIILETAATAAIACGMTYVMIGGDIDLSVGAMYAFSGTFAADLMQNQWSWETAALAALGAGMLLGLCNGVLSVKSGIPSFLITLGTLGIVSGLALTLTGTAPITIYDQQFGQVFGTGKLLGVQAPVWWAAGVAIVAGVILSRTVFGRYVYAVGGDREASRLAGIPVGRIRIANFVLAGFLAALAGLTIAARLSTGLPTIGGDLELDVITAVVIGGTNLFGGKGYIFGTIIGALIITIIGNGLVLTGINANMQTTIKGAILILTVIFRGV